MEHHGNNHQYNVVAIIPARYSSVRLPGKMLLPIVGRPLILHTLDRARSALAITRVIVATDDERIAAVVREAGGEVQMTASEHSSGSDRIAEVAGSLPEGTIIVNVQGDEPMLPPETIDRAVEAFLGDSDADIVTTWEPIERTKDVLDPNIVKVLTDETDRAIYFSRSPIPFPREAASRLGSLETALDAEPGLLSMFKKHTGIYAYRREFLLRYTEMSRTPLERAEMLEQLRALENGAVIKVIRAAGVSIGVDTEQDLERVRKKIEERPSAVRM